MSPSPYPQRDCISHRPSTILVYQSSSSFIACCFNHDGIKHAKLNSVDDHFTLMSWLFAVEDQGKCNSSPCVNGGTCINTGRSYRCDCSRGFYGRQCQFGMCQLISQLQQASQLVKTRQNITFSTTYSYCIRKYTVAPFVINILF